MTQMPPQPPQQSYPQQPGLQPGMQSHRGTMILVFGILGFVVCFIFGFVAWSMGGKDLKEIDAGRMDPTGRSLTNVGKILGMISGILGIIWAVLVVLMVISAIGAASVEMQR